MDKKVQNMLPKNINQYLLDRGISQTVIESANLNWDGHRIVIPVFDENRNFLFNKYRRSPDVEEGPKYMYDTGATSALYNLHTIISKQSAVYLCEGELDTLRLESAGYCAVSTTGGSGTFKEEWANFLKDKSIYICYDNDEAGLKGMLKVLEMIPEARIILLPEEKDITDYLKKNSEQSFKNLAIDAEQYDLSGKTKEVLDRMVDKKRKMNAANKDTRFVDFILDKYIAKYEEEKSIKHKKHSAIDMPTDRINRAKSVPINQLATFNHSGFRRCFWHNEKSGSLKYYQDKNRVHCFGCGKNADSIDVIMAMKQCTFTEAIDFLLGT